MLRNYKENGENGATSAAGTLMLKGNIIMKTQRVTWFARPAGPSSNWKMESRKNLLENYSQLPEVHMYREILYSDITLAVLIPFCILVVLIVGLAVIAKVKRQRKRLAIEYGIKDFMRQISG